MQDSGKERNFFLSYSEVEIYEYCSMFKVFTGIIAVAVLFNEADESCSFFRLFIKLFILRQVNMTKIKWRGIVNETFLLYMKLLGFLFAKESRSNTRGFIWIISWLLW